MGKGLFVRRVAGVGPSKRVEGFRIREQFRVACDGPVRLSVNDPSSILLILETYHSSGCITLPFGIK